MYQLSCAPTASASAVKQDAAIEDARKALQKAEVAGSAAQTLAASLMEAEAKRLGLDLYGGATGIGHTATELSLGHGKFIRLVSDTEADVMRPVLEVIRGHMPDIADRPDRILVDALRACEHDERVERAGGAGLTAEPQPISTQ